MLTSKCLIYNYREAYFKVIDVYEATKNGEIVPLDSKFWEEVDEEVRKLKSDLKLYKYDDVYGQVRDAYITLSNAVRKIIDARIYRIFMCIFQGLNPPKELSELELQLYNDIKALIDDFKAKLVPSLFSNNNGGRL